MNIATWFAIPCEDLSQGISWPSLRSIGQMVRPQMHGNHRIFIYSNCDLDLRRSNLICNPMQSLVSRNKLTKFEINPINGTPSNAWKPNFYSIVTVTLTFDIATWFAIPCEVLSQGISWPSLRSIGQTVCLQMHENQIFIYTNCDLDLRCSDLICNPMRSLVSRNKLTKFEINQTNGTSSNARKPNFYL